MCLKKKMALLTYFEAKTVSLPTERPMWSTHSLVKDLFCTKADEEPVVACRSFEYVDSESMGHETTLSHHYIRLSTETIRMQLSW